MNNTFSAIRIEKLPLMRFGYYVMISPNPETDVMTRMQEWANEHKLFADLANPPRSFGWDFPHLTDEQREKFGLRGYVYGYVLPETFADYSDSVRLLNIEAGEYATLRINDPFRKPFDLIPEGWRRLHDHVTREGLQSGSEHKRYWMEETLVIDSVTYMDLFYPIR